LRFLKTHGEGPDYSHSNLQLGRELYKVILTPDVDPDGASATGEDDEYWRWAMESTSHARLATNEVAQAAWLRIARGFFALARKRADCQDEPVAGTVTAPKSSKSTTLH
jgi:hypothetical protein